jgi:DNA repair protein RadA/Sms
VCTAWNSLVEEVEGPEESRVSLAAGLALVPPGLATPIGDVNPNESDPVPTGIDELDRVLGGGLVPGSVTLLGGEPGIGKSTLLLQLLGGAKGPSLYVTAEESAQQVRLRADRLGAISPDLWLLPEMSLPNIIAPSTKFLLHLLLSTPSKQWSTQSLVHHPVQLCKYAGVRIGWCKKRNVAIFQ